MRWGPETLPPSQPCWGTRPRRPGGCEGRAPPRPVLLREPTLPHALLLKPAGRQAPRGGEGRWEAVGIGAGASGLVCGSTHLGVQAADVAAPHSCLRVPPGQALCACASDLLFPAGLLSLAEQLLQTPRTQVSGSGQMKGLPWRGSSPPPRPGVRGLRAEVVPRGAAAPSPAEGQHHAALSVAEAGSSWCGTEATEALERQGGWELVTRGAGQGGWSPGTTLPACRACSLLGWWGQT